MATVAAETLAGSWKPPETGGRGADVIDFPHPQLDEGLFVSPEGLAAGEAARNYVADQERLKTSTSKHGLISSQIVTMENGRQYEHVSGEPRQQRSDIPVFFTTALGTSVHGHNRHTMHKVMDLGYPVELVGPEGGHANWPKTPAGLRRFLHNLVNIGIEETAGNMHEILDVADESGRYEPGQAIVIGESRASMVGMVMIALAHQYGRQVPYADLIAPCFPEGIASARELSVLPKQLVTQTSLLGNLPLKMSPRRLLHMPRTINPNPYFLLHVAATVPTLLSGRAGQLAHEIDRDAKIHNTIFTGDAWSHGEGWDKVFTGYPFVINTYRPGNHMAIAKPETQQDRLDRLGGLREELEANHHDLASIDWDNVHMAGRLALVG